MVKTEPKIDEKEANWMDDIDIESVNKVADLNIMPQLSFPMPTKTESFKERVMVKTLPKITEFADGNKYFTMLVLHDGIEKQLVAQAKSLRFNLAVLIKKIGIEKLMENEIQIEKFLGNTKERKNVPLYSVRLI